jgi:hypothetical protein
MPQQGDEGRRRAGHDDYYLPIVDINLKSLNTSMMIDDDDDMGWMIPK